MEKFIVLFIAISAVFALSACEECKDCDLIIGDSQLEEEACEDLADCTAGDFEPITEVQCRQHNYPYDCWVEIIEAKHSCSAIKEVYQSDTCQGEDSNNFSSNNSSYSQATQDLCMLVRHECGYDDNNSWEFCLEELEGELGAEGLGCINDAGTDCSYIEDCLDFYTENFKPE